jgi:hypothetical protein
LLFVCYRCGNLSLTLKEEHSLKVFEKRELRKKAGTKREEVKSNWRKLHVKELHDVYSYQILSALFHIM